MGKVAVIATMRAKEGQRDELAKAIESCMEHIEQEPGTLRYILHEHDSDPDALIFYELYEDKAALEAHGSGEAVKALGAALRPYLGGRPELVFLTPLTGKGL
jgi:quinol monooxygenase YgiN